MSEKVGVCPDGGRHKLAHVAYELDRLGSDSKDLARPCLKCGSLVLTDIRIQDRHEVNINLEMNL